jgi:mono/diheme cytochrome c family protein
MSRAALNWLLLALLALTAAASWTVDWNAASPNTEFLPEMVRSVPYDSFSANPVFADGKTLQQPVQGTIPRGFLPLHYEKTEEDLARAGRELQNPYSIEDKEAAARGAELFRRTCTPCHGPGGAGDGAIAQRGYPPPPSLLAENALNLRDGQIFHILTYGKGNMPPYAAQISREDRWKVILHIRSLQAKREATPAPPPNSTN